MHKNLEVSHLFTYFVPENLLKVAFQSHSWQKTAFGLQDILRKRVRLFPSGESGQFAF